MDSVCNHFVNIVEVVIGFPQVSQRYECFCLDGTKLLVCSFFVFNVHFVPFFQHLNWLFFPCLKVIRGQTINLACFELNLPDTAQVLLAIEMIDIWSVGDWVFFSIYLDNLRTLEKHRTKYTLLVWFCFASGYLQLFTHVKEIVKDWLPVLPDVFVCIV